MKKIIYCLLPLLLLFTACEETVEIGKYDNWQVRNEAFIDSLQQVYDAKTDPELFGVIDSRDKSQRIFFKKLPGSTIKENKSPFLTDSVNTFYRGMLINEAVFAKASPPKYYTTLYKELDVFDYNFSGDSPSEFDSFTTFKVSGVVNGWIEILQRMKVGERWEIYIPWKSAYGSTAHQSIPAYSVLIFDVQLEGIKEFI